MGGGIAQVAAAAGLDVRLLDVDRQALERAVSQLEGRLSRRVDREKMSAEAAQDILRRIEPGTDLSAHLAGADVIIEAVSERSEVKQKVFAEMDANADEETILASNTSSISITWLGAQTKRPASVIGMHFFNPVPAMKLVEVVRGLETGVETVERTKQLAEKLGKTPIEVADAPGFVSNRVLMPMINEAIYCLMEGLADAEGIDDVMKLGMAHPMGPLALADLIGLDVCLDIMEVLHRDLGEDRYRPCPLLRKYVAAGRLGRKSGRGFFPY